MMATEQPVDKCIHFLGGSLGGGLIRLELSLLRRQSSAVGFLGGSTSDSPQVYDILAPHTNQLDIWETEYIHTLESSDAIVDWMASTGLRPFLSALQKEEERSEFLKELRAGVALKYQTRIDGKVLFPFRRLFIVASRR